MKSPGMPAPDNAKGQQAEDERNVNQHQVIYGSGNGYADGWRTQALKIRGICFYRAAKR
jgi:glutamine synthetase type III